MTTTAITETFSLPTVEANPILPTVDEIEAATEVLSTTDTSAKVVRIGRFAVKSGSQVPLIEAENIRFIAANSSVPVPNLHAAFRDPGTNKTYIVMDYIPGKPLRDVLPSLNIQEKARICELIKDALTELRNIPPPDYLGMLNHSPFLDEVFWTPGLNPRESGPFKKQEDMNRAIIASFRGYESEAYIRLLQTMVDKTLHGHRTVLTHGDLQPKNIVVERLTDCEELPDFKITLVDWESAGWFPEFRERLTCLSSV